MKSHQQLFDEAAIGVIKQGAPSMFAGACQYLTQLDDGTVLKCSVGHLLANDEIRRRWDWEDFNIDSIINMDECQFADLVADDFAASGIPDDEETLKLLDSLQDAHDRASGNFDFIEKFKRQMTEVAVNFQLSPLCCKS